MDSAANRKGATWKVQIAAALKQHTQAPNGWIAEQLHMGSGAAVSQYVARARRIPPGPKGLARFN